MIVQFGKPTADSTIHMAAKSTFGFHNNYNSV